MTIIQSFISNYFRQRGIELTVPYRKQGKLLYDTI